MRKSLLLFLVMSMSMVGLNLKAQMDFIMGNMTDNGCDGTFYDDGGTGGAAYSDTDYTYTICPDVPGDVIQVDFAAFQLQLSGNPNNHDALTIYDGNSTAAQSLGTYTGNFLQGLNVTGTVNNTSGCLTFVFVVNTGNTTNMPGWEASVICTTPCDPPTASSSIVNPPPPVFGFDSVSICVGDFVDFSGLGSSAAPGFTLDGYFWNFDDGSIDSTSGNAVSHQFNEPGEYIVSLAVQDNNGCQNLNFEPLKVIVSTLPDFQLSFPDTICVGEIAPLVGEANSVTWTAAPPFAVAGESFLADGAGFSFNSELLIDIFNPGDTLADCNDLLELNINIEHSYLGDLDMIIECPNGTQVSLHDYLSQGGGGTYLGEAVDGSSVPGTGYDYGWSPTSTLGFLDDAANWTDVSFVDNAGNPDMNNIVNPGIYTPFGDLCDLVGCPLNGTWTFIVTDNLAADDGYIFNWGIEFDPALYPGITTFTPSYGPLSDSTFWTGDPNFTFLSADADSAEFVPPSAGSYDFIYNSVNDFGCEVDTVITIVVVDPHEVVADPDVIIACGAPTQLGVEVLGGPPPPTDCDFELQLSDFWGDGWQGAFLDIEIDGVLTSYTLPNGIFQTFAIPAVPNGAAITITYTAGISPEENEWVLLDSNGDVWLQDGQFNVSPQPGIFFDGTANCGGGGATTYVYSWFPTTSLDDPNIQYPISTGLMESTMFVVSVYEAGNPACIAVDSMYLELSGALTAGPDLANCAMSYEMNAEVVGIGQWSTTDPAIISFSDDSDPNAIVYATQPGTYTLGWVDTQGLSCPNSDFIELTFFDGIQIEPTIVIPECFGDCTGTISVVGTGGVITPGLDYIYTWDAGTPGVNINERQELCSGNVTVIMEDENGCVDQETFFIDQPAAPVIDSLTVMGESCLGYCDGQVIIHSAVASTYSFDGGFNFLPDSVNNELCAGFQTVIIRDANSCEGDAEALITSPTPPEANFLVEPAQASVLNPVFQTTNTSEDNVSNEWFFGAFGYADTEHATVEFPAEPGFYNIELVITDSIGCLDSLDLNVEVIEEFQIFIPSAFSPNADGINDNFDVTIQDLDPSQYEFSVFDRWGRVVYSSTEYPTRWNGESHEDYEYYVADGVYMWRINARALTTTTRKEFSGQVTVIR
jgi:gliding motility-associated-like protein